MYHSLCSHIYCFFFLMIRRPPRSTLFPYTNALPISLKGCRLCLRSTRERRVGGSTAPCAGLPRSRSCRRGGRDRKSTRLNSSHDQISYAVFCLKKKKTNRVTFNVDSMRATSELCVMN